jgi:hypothetical protein
MRNKSGEDFQKAVHEITTTYVEIGMKHGEDFAWGALCLAKQQAEVALDLGLARRIREAAKESSK